MRFNSTLPDTSVNVSKQHPLRDAILLVASIAALSIFGVIVIALAIDLLVPYFPPPLEQKLFSLIELDEDSDDDESIDSRRVQIQAMADRLAGHWPENPYTLRVSILDDESMNAFAMPGGRIAITKGLLESATSEIEVAFVLGHEIGHFQQRDHLRGIGRGVGIAIMLSAFDVGGAGAASELLGGATGIAGRHFDRSQESGADRVGLDLVWREYGHVSGATDLFEHLPDPTGAIEKKFQSYLATHPVDADRIEALNELARERGWAQNEALTPFPRDD